ncbi:MAG: peptide chain release factor 1 [Acidobacteriota bacterium]|nr:peptide chain release factor 1 [Acidobacteriota bacterium]MDH3786913.1 peptide chain release factor 1 [Acidobacteriota bacterium]
MAGTLDPKLDSKLQSLVQRSEELSANLADPEVTSDMDRYRRLTRSYADLEPIVGKYRECRQVQSDLEGAGELLETAGDAEMRAMAADEVKTLESQLKSIEHEIRLLLLPKDPNDDKNVVLEIRAGAGGDEASLFAAELFRMYTRYAEGRNWKVRTTDISASSVGGVKEVIAMVEGTGVYSQLKYESGVHRVQRVPETEAQGRIHTSAVTVAVLPEAEDVEVDLAEKELRIDTFCSSGPGGQSVNTTQSAVRITHLPTGLVVQCQDEKSWHKNKASALKVLRSRLYDKMQQEQHDAIAEERRGMVGGGDRSEKIRTYNFPQSRITDHRISLTVHNLPAVMDGEIGPIFEALVAHDQAELLRQEVQS